ncbi:MAG: hypothetical protein IPG08_17080 [Sphingobacteriaceae bacterium]|nr:hypothetical protein [Sphingobacteriaceae bacterium]
MNFWKRLRFYGIGFGIGLLIVYAMFGNRTCASPGQVKMRELSFQYFRLSDKARCKMNCLKLNEHLLKIKLRHFEINYDKSDVHKIPCGSYFIEEQKEHAGEYNFNLVIYDCDSVSEINDINILKAPQTCTCQ